MNEDYPKMTPDQLRELTTLSANVAHLVKSFEEVREDIKGLATRSELKEFITRREHDYETQALEGRVQRLEEQVKDNAPMSVWQRGTQVLAGVSLFFAVIGGLVAAARFFLVK